MDIARYLNQKFFAKELSNHINLIKKDLVYTISNKHPKSQFSITDREKFIFLPFWWLWWRC